MSKRKEEYVERLEAQIRELKSENRSLLKRVRRLSKGYRKFLDQEHDEDVKEAPKAISDEIKACWECTKGVLIKKVVLNRSWRECTVCPKRTRVKILI